MLMRARSWPSDLLVVPTVTFRLLFVLVLLAHDRRRIVHVAVTKHPTAAWTAQRLRNTFPDNEAPGYLVHDPRFGLCGRGNHPGGNEHSNGSHGAALAVAERRR